MTITNQMLYDAWKKVADAVSSNKMQVDVKSTPVDAKLDQILAKLTEVETEIEAIKSTDGIKRIDETVPVQLTGSNVLKIPQRGLNPVPPYFPVTIVDNGNVELKAMDKNGALYGVRFREVVKSDDDGATWTQIWVPPNTTPLEYPVFIVPLDNGALVVTTNYPSGGRYDGHIYTSTTDQSTFTKVLDTPRACQGNRYGKDVFRNFVMFTEYGPKMQGVDSARRAYLSKDYGQTFTKIFELADHYQVHTHDINFDPYAGRIWISVGDQSPQQNVYYSDDWGDSWKTLWEPGKSPINPLSIACLPDCVLIGSDNADAATIWRYDRSTEAVEKVWELPNSTANGTYVSGSSYTQQLDSGAVIAYIPFHSGSKVAGMEEYSVILATSNGFDFSTVWRSTELADLDQDFVLFAGEKDGDLYARPASKKMMIFKLPEWK